VLCTTTQASPKVTPDGRLPNPDTGRPGGADKDDAAHLREVFGRMGFNDQEIVALSGAHALGRCHVDFSGVRRTLDTNQHLQGSIIVTTRFF
jgi:catalase (peroxidase I)